MWGDARKQAPSVRRAPKGLCKQVAPNEMMQRDCKLALTSNKKAPQIRFESEVLSFCYILSIIGAM